jgi:hypothetical protein
MKRPLFTHFASDVTFQGVTVHLRMFRLGALVVTYWPRPLVTWEAKRDWELAVLKGEAA